ncbi:MULTISPECIES: MlaD family protein [unclassified Rhodococcus (in: high G+C Gram-positive bacteria)]|uniref:MlaD family protein n=1 Tax=unclassified Rhodococcus (in: high G+C Gram-positive bacteria) TaxID=192944 RepID=UPI00117B4BA3|nr:MULTISPECIES: MlaD family protein [unclassified Rhodococcus (in: high G+C Gram-positive bacteria)]
MSIAAAVAVTVSLAAAGTVMFTSAQGEQDSSFCAYFADSIGLYVGNPVTQMGYDIGSVHSIDPQGDRVRIDFDIDTNRSFPADVKAVIRSKSLLADRSLELVGNYGSGPELPHDECIALTDTATPKSLSEITGSASDFLQAVSSDDTESVATAVEGLDDALKGQGENIDELFANAEGAMTNPDRAVADVGTIVTDLAPFTTTTLDNWDTAKQLLAVLPEDLEVGASGLWDGVTKFIGGLSPVLADILDIQVNYGEDINGILGDASTALRLASTRSADVSELFSVIPVTSQLVSEQLDGSPALHAAPPQIAVNAPDPQLLCTALNTVAPTTCTPTADGVLLRDLGVLDGVLAGAQP